MRNMTVKQRRRPQGLGFIAICMVACFVAGSGLAVGLTHRETPSSLLESSDVGSLTLQQSHFDDSRTLTLDVTTMRSRSISFPLSGTVTRAECADDGIVKSGSYEYDVDGIPLMSLHTDVPLYRDLNYGDTGEDVASLQKELARLGYENSLSGTFDWATWNAWKNLYRTAGGMAQSGTLDISRIIWIPSGDLYTTGCVANLGTSVSTDGETSAFSTTDSIRQIKASSLPSDRISGDRTVEINGQSFAIDEDGNVADPAAISAMLTWVNYTSNRKEGQEVTSVSVNYKLAEPIAVYSVPAQSLIGLKQSSGCIINAVTGKPVQVRVMGSSLGRTLISLEESEQAPRRIQAAPQTELCNVR